MLSANSLNIGTDDGKVGLEYTFAGEAVNEKQGRKSRTVR
jgi:hypothetical protein